MKYHRYDLHQHYLSEHTTASMSGAVEIGPKVALAPARARLRQIALVTKDLEHAQRLIVWPSRVDSTQDD